MNYYNKPADRIDKDTKDEVITVRIWDSIVEITKEEFILFEKMGLI